MQIADFIVCMQYANSTRYNRDTALRNHNRIGDVVLDRFDMVYRD